MRIFQDLQLLEKAVWNPSASPSTVRQQKYHSATREILVERDIGVSGKKQIPNLTNFNTFYRKKHKKRMKMM